MAHKSFRLVALRPSSTGSNYAHIGYDKAVVTAPNAHVKLEGTAGVHKTAVVKHIPNLALLIVKHWGYTTYIDRGSGNKYSPACFVIYEYVEKMVGNEIHLYVDLFGIAELPLSWKPGAR